MADRALREILAAHKGAQEGTRRPSAEEAAREHYLLDTRLGRYARYLDEEVEPGPPALVPDDAPRNDAPRVSPHPSEAVRLGLVTQGSGNAG